MVQENQKIKALHKHMQQHGCAPSESPIADDQSHIYEVLAQGLLRLARYVASWYPQEGTDNFVLVCSYGFLDEQGGGFVYSSAMEK